MTKFKVGMQVRTRDGRDARIICVDAKASEPIIALVRNHTGRDNTYHYYDNGKYFSGEKHDLDLMPPEPERVEFEAIWREHDNLFYPTGEGQSPLRDHIGKLTRVVVEVIE